jgi:transcriptional regulator with XRE-family HTH domain
MPIITPEQCRAARGLLNWSQRELVERSGVSQKAIADFERGVSTPYPRTLKDVVSAFEAGGVMFIEPREHVTGLGVAFRWGVQQVSSSDNQSITADGTPEGGLHSRAWDDDLEETNLNKANLGEDDRRWLEYIKTTPNLSDRGRGILLKTVRQ